MTISPTINSVHGRIRSITGNDPAAGDEISITVPARRRWKIHSIHFTLNTDATVADRIIVLQVTDGTNLFFELADPTAQIASSSIFRCFSHFGAPPSTGHYRTALSIPPLPLAAEYQIKTSTSFIQDGDNYTTPQLLVEEWIDP